MLAFTHHVLSWVGCAVKQPTYQRQTRGHRNTFHHTVSKPSELARLLPVIHWGPVRAPPGGYQWHPRPGMACAPSRLPPSRPCCMLAYAADTTICAVSRRGVGKRGRTSSPPLVWALGPKGWRRRRVAAVVWWGMLPGVSESHSITLSSWAPLRRAAGTSRSHLGRSGAWQGAAGLIQLLFKPWQQSAISVSQQEMQGGRQSTS